MAILDLGFVYAPYIPKIVFKMEKISTTPSIMQRYGNAVIRSDYYGVVSRLPVGDNGAEEIAKEIDEKFIKDIMSVVDKEQNRHRRLVQSYTELQRDEYYPNKKEAVLFLEKIAWSSEVRKKLVALDKRLKEEASATHYWDPEEDGL